MPLKLGLPHLAHLRAVAEGVGVAESAQRYLAAENAYAAMRLHAPVVLQARALGRAMGNPAWRLIGAHLRANVTGEAPPSIESWAEKKGYGGFSAQDLIDFYEAEFPPDRKLARGERLRLRVRALLQQIECQHVAEARPWDLIEDWVTEPTAGRLREAGLVLLSDLQKLIGGAGRWWRDIPSMGPAKGNALARYLAELLPVPDAAHSRPWQGALVPVAAPLKPHQSAPVVAVVEPRNEEVHSHRDSTNDAPAHTSNDADAIEAWIRGRGVNELTARSYRREARRLCLWASIECRKALYSMNAEDCAAYVRFLGEIPPSWIGRPAPIGDVHWTPFARQLSAASRRQSHTILKSLFEWLHQAGYLQRNPWYLVGTKVADDEQSVEALLNTRAFTPEAWAAIVAYLDVPTDEPAHLRARFAFRFCEGTGLRAAELLKATLGDLRLVEGGWYLMVIGKGGKARAVLLTAPARSALDEYLLSRGLPVFVQCAGDLLYGRLPLLANLEEPERGLGYQSFYESVKRALKYALQHCDLPDSDRKRAMNAAPHWLRRTFGTRAKERGVSDQALMAQLGHASVAALKPYTRAQAGRVREELEGAFL